MNGIRNHKSEIAKGTSGQTIQSQTESMDRLTDKSSNNKAIKPIEKSSKQWTVEKGNARTKLKFSQSLLLTQRLTGKPADRLTDHRLGQPRDLVVTDGPTD